MPAQIDTQINAETETPMTLNSDPLGGPGRVINSGMDLPLNQLTEENETAAMLAT